MYRIWIVIFCGLLIYGCGSEQEGSNSSEHVLQKVLPTNKEDSTVASQKSTSFKRKTTSVGQLVYVPVYSHIYQRNRQKTFNLTTTLSIRNADPYRSFTVTDVAYFDSNGNEIQQYVESGQQIDPLASTSFVIEEADLRGGVGANFLVEWESEEPVFPPVIEAVNISTSQQQGISFLSVGRVLQERSATQTDDN
ncbi:MAG: DUF3124 domain-containing protein [Bacteroidota bacterium]